MQARKKVMIVAGEASGEMYGARIAAGLRALLPDVELFGMGGDCMRREGVDTLVDANVMAVMGIVEVVAHLPTIAKGFTTLKKRLLNDPPDLVICIDYPDFNLRLGKVAKDAGIKVLHFVSPTIWAWRPGRIHGIGRAINRMAVLFPFEVPYYERAGIPVSFVGHPLLDMVHPSLGKDEAVRSFGLDPSRRTLGLFPGSRKSVLKRLLPVVLESARRLKERFPDLQFLLPLASSLREADLAPYLDGCGLEIKVVSGRNYDLMVACDAAISVSGTVIMELALVGVPMVLIYKVPWLNYEIGKRVINVDHIGICNIVAEKRVVQELIQHEAEPPQIVAEIERILSDPAYNAKMRAELAEVRVRLGSGGALERLAQVAADMLETRKS